VPLQGNYSEALPAHARVKRKDINIMSCHRSCFANVGYMNRSVLPSFCGHVLFSFVQFLLAQSTSEYCQSKMFSASHDLAFPQPDLSSSCPQCCAMVVSLYVQSSVIFVRERVATIHFWPLLVILIPSAYF